ncbi:hypothetical protein [Streptomyces sp. NP160]|uniref:hypothetical protein n=1 Tax=Streptomyces sp. NP160 TaxID=2586637 RepID=UPI0015D6006F|nr:hypothetical protein [Streptomyces sp. NP160]
MVVLVDLDGTLVDSGAAFSAWAHRFVLGHGGDDDVPRLVDRSRGADAKTR